MSDLDNIVWGRRFLHVALNHAYTPEYIHGVLKGLGMKYSLEDVKKSMEKLDG